MLAEKERQTKAFENYTLANRKLIEAYGDRAKEIVAIKASELGIAPGMLKAMAESSPKAFLAVLGLNGAPHQAAARAGAGGELWLAEPGLLSAARGAGGVLRGAGAAGVWDVCGV